MKTGTSLTFEHGLDDILAERARIAEEIARLKARDEQLVRKEERLRYRSFANSEKHLVTAAECALRLDMSIGGFHRLISNPARNFPKPRMIDSDRRWVWDEVLVWLEEYGQKEGQLTPCATQSRSCRTIGRKSSSNPS